MNFIGSFEQTLFGENVKSAMTDSFLEKRSELIDSVILEIEPIAMPTKKIKNNESIAIFEGKKLFI